jgi:uncharacterized protein (TIGR03000 family)
MLRRTFAFGGTLLVAAALVFLTPSPSRARGGFHGGGFHGGGFRAGGFHGGGFRGGYRPGFRAGGSYYHPSYGGYRSNWYRPYYGGYRRWGWGSYYPWYGGYYGYPSYLYSNPYYYGYPSYGAGLTSVPTYDPGYSSFYYEPAPSTTYIAPSSDLSSEPAQPDASARVTVTLPAGARLWVNQQAMAVTGTTSEFDSPQLTPGNQYTYVLQASWDEGGRRVMQTQHVEVTAGSHVNVRFPAPAPAQGK